MSASTDQSDTYILSRDFLASARLSFQHDIYIARQGYLLHPSVTSSFPQLSSPATSTSNPTSSSPPAAPIQILDLGTGNGIWATDLATTLGPAAVEITALDISPTQFPAPAIRPPNVSFGEYNFLNDVPEPLVSKFDIVHARFIAPGFLDPTSPPTDQSKRDRVISNIHRMLKPRGWLQWQETAYPYFGQVESLDRVMAGGAQGQGEGEAEIKLSSEWDPASMTLDKYLSIRSRISWTSSIDTLLASSGLFADLAQSEPPVRKDKLKQESDLCCWNLWEAMQGLLKLVKGDAGKEISDAVSKLMDEIKRGEKVMASRLVVCVGRKA